MDMSHAVVFEHSCIIWQSSACKSGRWRVTQVHLFGRKAVGPHPVRDARLPAALSSLMP